MARQRTKFGEALVALIARVEAFAAFAHCHRNWRCWSKTLSSTSDATTAAKFVFFPTMGRHTSRRGDVSTIITASVTWFASFVTRSNWSHRRSLQCFFLSSRNIWRLRRQLAIETALNSAESNEINLLNQRFTLVKCNEKITRSGVRQQRSFSILQFHVEKSHPLLPS